MQALLSENWHSVRGLKPRLRAGVRIYHRIFRQKPAVLLFDPSSHRFHRLSSETWRVVELFDGERTVEEIWDAAALSDPASENVRADRGEAIGQHDLVQLLSQLYGADLLHTQVTPDAFEVLERFERQRKAKLKQLFLNPLSIKLPLLHPEPWLRNQVSIAYTLFSRWALLFWLALVLPAVVVAATQWDLLTENLSDRVLSAQNLMIAWFTYPVVKALHEWSHALAVKRWGGAVREAGLMFLVFTPVPYVDATDSYAFADKWQRATVAAAGILAELALGAIAVYVWVLAEPGLLRAIAYNVILIAGVSTPLVNGNPLMRYDGYFVLSELIEIPNLAQRAPRFWTYVLDRHVFRAESATSPAHSTFEALVLGIYGLIAPVYRLSVSLGLAWFVAQEYFVFGVVMAIAGLWSSIAMPVWRGWKHLRGSPSLGSRHDYATRRTSLVVAVSLLVICFLPLPFSTVEEGVLWVPERAIVRAREAGHLQLLPERGERLHKGDLVGVLLNPALAAEAAKAQSQVDELSVRFRQDLTQDAAKADATRRQMEAAEKKSAEASRHAAELELVAGDDGIWILANGYEAVGQYFKRGQTVGYVVNGPSPVLRVAISQEDIELVRTRTKKATVRLARRPWEELGVRRMRPVLAGQEQLVSSALGSDGGGAVPVDPSQADGTKPLNRVFDYELELTAADPVAAFGDRAHVRFDLGYAPLAEQWFLRLRQAFLARFNV